MKTLKPLFILAACVIFSLTACRKSDYSPLISRSTNGVVGGGGGGGSTTLAGTITFKFNGAAKNYTTVIATYYKATGSLQVMGMQGTQVISLMVEKVKVGTFDVANNEVLATYSNTPDYNDSYISSTGKVMITKFTNDAVAGTFQFSGSTPLNQAGTVTEGTFSGKMITI